MRKVFFIAFIVSSLLLTRAVFGYDDKTTHPALTDEIIDFYNFRNRVSISSEEKEWIVKGSILEDTEPRYVNHFYDPIYKVGWTGERGVIPQETMQKLTDIAIAPLGAVSALNWVHNQELQTKYQRYLGNKTWEKAIYEYVKNKNKQEAYLALGHVLHLLEDMAVPEHTRNDTHTPLNESPYESYAARYNRDNIDVFEKVKNQTPPAFNSLDEYFEELANYSNNYFFSRDTINDGKYSKPEIIKEDGNYGYGVDRNGDEFILVTVERKRIQENNQFKELKIYNLLETEPYKPILESYFIRLSRASVLSGAGVIRLFFEEVEKAEKDPSLLKPPPENQSAMLSIYGEIFKIKTTIVNTANAAINTGTKLVDRISNILDKYVTGSAGQPASIVASLPASQPDANLTSSDDVRLENADVQHSMLNTVPATPRVAGETAEVGPSQTFQTTTVVGSSADTNLRPSQDHILVPVIPPKPKPVPAGTGGSSGTFTPSLPNPGFGGGSLESSQAAATPRVAGLPPPQDNTAPNPPVVASPTDFSSAFISTDISFSGTAEARSIISNDFNSATTTADENGLWSFSFSFNEGSTTIKFFAKDAAGNVSGSTDASLFIDSISPTIQAFSISECANSLSSGGCLVAVTSLNLSWQSLAGDLDYFELIINGAISATTSTSTIVSVSDNSVNNFSIRAKDISGNWSNASTTAAEISLMPVVINEIAWAGTSGHSEDEWIELYNRASKEINLNNWILYSQTDFKPYINLTGTIPANGYYLIERTNDTTVSDVLADWKGSFGSTDGGGSGLANTGEVLILSHASTTIDQTPSGAWPGGDSNIYRTMERYEPDSSGSDSSNWGTNNIVIKNGKNADNQNLNATPKARNSANYLINKNNPALSSNLTLAKSNSPYLVDNTLMNIGAAATLTIEPGVVIKFYNDAGFSVFGKIISRGTETDPIIFESFDNNYWYGVDVFAAGSVFDHSTFRKGGKWYNGTGKSMANLFIKDFSAAITNSIFEYSKVYGLKLENSNSTISNNTIRHNNNENDPAGYNAGLAILNGSPSVQSNSFQNNRRGIYSFSPLATINANSFSSNTQEAILSSGVPANFTNNSGSGNATNGIFLSSGDIAQASATTTLKANPLPYAFDSGLNIPLNSGLIVESGVNVHASGGFFGGRLDVYGNLVFNGVNSGDIVFSSGGSSPAAGDWRGIRVYGNSNIKGATFKHADKAISYYNSPIKLENIKFESNNLAVYADGASAGQTYAGQSITALLIEFINQIATTSPVGLW